MKLIILLLGLTFLASCGSKTENDFIVPSLSPSQIRAVQTQIAKGQIPGPEEVLTQNAPVVSACDTFIASLPNDYIHGYLKVPENKEDPKSPFIDIFYYGKLIEGQTPVVFFNGGPGSDSHSSFRVLSTMQKTVPSWNNVSFVYLDQRGNGCSANYPQGSDDKTLERLRHYGSRDIVNDAEAVRVLLRGDKPWKAFGQSYGAFIIHRYANLYPKNLVSAHAHAGVITSSAFDRLKGRIASQNRVIEVYFNAYPSDEISLSAVNQYLGGKCFTDEKSTAKVCGLRAMAPMILLLGFTDQWLKIHKWIQVMAPEGVIDPKGASQYLQTLYFSGVADSANNKSIASAVIGFIDRNVIASTKENCVKVYAALKAEGADFRHALLNECLASLGSADSSPSDLMLRIQKLKLDLLSLQDFKSSLTGSALPFYLYSGQKDPYVPVEDFAEELNFVQGLITYKNFPSTGHDGFFTEPLVWSNLAK